MQSKTSSINCRMMLEADVPAILSMTCAYYAETPIWSGLELSIEKMDEHLTDSLMDDDQMVLVATDGSTPIGYMWVCIHGQVWTDDPIGSDIILYVGEKYRGTGAGNLLVSRAEEWFEACGVKAIHLGSHSGINNEEGATKLYERRGYKSGGRDFYKPLED